MYRTRRRTQPMRRKRPLRRRRTKTMKYRRTYARRRYVKRGRQKSMAAPFHNKQVKRSFKTNIIRPFSAYNTTRLFQNSSFYTITISTINTNIGHNAIDAPLATILSLADLNWIKAKYRYWQLNSVHFTIKVLAWKNMAKFENVGSSLTTYAYGMQTESPNFHELYFGFFRDGNSQSEAQAIDPDASASNKEKLLEGGNYRRLSTQGYSLNIHWYQPKAFNDLRDDTSLAASLATPIYSSFANSVAARNQPHGFDIMWCNRDRYIDTTPVTEKPTLQIQIFGTASINLSQPLFSNF